MTRKAAFLFFFMAILSLVGCTGKIENLGQSATVSAVNVSCSPTGVQPGQTSQCSAAVTGTGNISQSVVWSAVAGTISNSGLYTAPSSMPSSGSDTITATSTQDASIYKKINVSINSSGIQPDVTSVSVSAAPASITTAQTAACKAAVAGSGSYSNAVSWTAKGGTISENGMFTPTGSGTATCTANSAQAGYTNVSGSANITVTAPPAAAPVTVTSISVIAAPSSINTGQTSTCAATVAGTGSFTNAVTWTSTGGTITQGGVLTPSDAGTASCIAHSAQAGYTNISGSASIAVSAPSSSSTVTGVSVSAAPSSITTAQTSTCSATVTGTGTFSNAVTWTATGGSITPAGVFTPSGTGTGSCSAHSAQSGYTNIGGSANIAVSASSATVTGITVVAAPASINASQTSTCAATVTGTGSYSNAVTWTATGGTISPAGVFTPSGAGTGSCIAHAAQAGFTNVTGLASITVASAPFTITSISVLAVPASISTAQTTTCAATVSGTGPFSNAVTWSASGGTISSSGVFTPSASGNATCTANSSVLGFLNISGTAHIAITTAAAAINGVSLACTPSSITTSQTATCTPTVTGTGAFTNTVNLSISPTAGGSLSSSTSVASGSAVTITPATTGAGTAIITATSTEDATKTATAVISVTVPGSTPSCGGMSLGNMASLNGFVPFPTTSPWNTDISAAPVDPDNATIVADVDFAGEHLHHDWSSVAGGNYGMPYTVVDSSTTPLVPINVVAYAGNSDVTNAPFPITAPIEGGQADCTGGPTNYIGDAHVLVLDRNRCMLYETYNTTRCNGAWSADSETLWDMQAVEQRPWGWTSGDAAGLSIFAGLVRYDEVAAGAINHALRFTMQNTRSDNAGGYFVEPATHAAGSSSASHIVMGMRIRLKASFDISGYSAANQVILTAMKKYGMIVADNGGNFFFTGVPDPRWDDNDLINLDEIESSNFEVVQMTPSWPGWDANTAPTGPAPTINSFTASASTVAVGTPVTLTWSTTNDSYDFIDKLGGVHGNTVTFTPTAAGTITYTLTATNQYGPSTKAVTIVIQ
jgi:hypothetical protein